MTKKPVVYICSPYSGDVVRNTENARRYCRFAVDHGRVPIAPHLLFPQFMSERLERDEALQMGIRLLELCDELWICCDRVSSGMQAEIEYMENVLRRPIRHISDVGAADQ